MTTGRTLREDLRDPKTHARAAHAIRNLARLVGDDMAEIEKMIAFEAEKLAAAKGKP